jgi:hypothetical protein
VVAGALAQFTAQGLVVGTEHVDPGGAAFHLLQPFHRGAQLLFQAGGALQGAGVLQPLNPVLQLLDAAALLAGLGQHRQEQHRQQGGEA